MMLSLEQQGIIENSIWVVNTALKRQGLQADEDLRQSAILYMCKCLERFDPTKNIKWSTYAYKNVFLFIKRTHGKEIKKHSHLTNDDITNIQISIEQPRVFNESQYVLNSIKRLCTIEESRILELKLQGYKVIEISNLIGCSTSKINACMQSIREKAREIRNEEREL